MERVAPTFPLGFLAIQQPLLQQPRNGGLADTPARAEKSEGASASSYSVLGKKCRRYHWKAKWPRLEPFDVDQARSSTTPNKDSRVDRPLLARSDDPEMSASLIGHLGSST